MKKQICVVVPIIQFAEAFLLGHLDAMTAMYEVCLVTNFQGKEYLRRRGLMVEVLHAPIPRRPSPLRDLLCLFALIRLIRHRKCDVVHSITPKTGLLTMLAAWLIRTPTRIHTFTGQPWATRGGLARVFLKSLDMLTAACATHILVDSPSQLEFLVREQVVDRKKASVLANGSLGGVNTTRFHPQPELRDETRSTLLIPPDAMVFAFLGRMTRDKGVLDLAAAFSQVTRAHPNAYLIYVGRDEEKLTPIIERLCQSCVDRLRFVDHTPTPEVFMVSADVLCLPSYREGFGAVIIEAAACGVPALASRIYGITDALVDGVTGAFHEPGDTEGLARSMRKMIEDPAWRSVSGQRARLRAETEFAGEMVTAAMLRYYHSILN